MASARAGQLADRHSFELLADMIKDPVNSSLRATNFGADFGAAVPLQTQYDNFTLLGTQLSHQALDGFA
jgi:hypothetical protein